ncbi:unnamed protein product [Rotaria socialis]|uniref:ADP ribosyltransferase domain-containing protein n=1 Tax=Rotaria socialis TaxID=392032 RepID=A0A818CXD1_9BILA|nr:unnamed protein product [Rotaria socialis]CAF4687164.1 unnamed protein product [Rotaria socialis]
MMQPLSTASVNNVETFHQIWLCDSVSNSQEFADAQGKLRTWIENIKIFEDVIQCEQFIRSLSDVDRIIFIVDDLLGLEIIPLIHQFRQVFAIYVYCTRKQTKEPLFQHFTKFRATFTNLNELIDSIRLNHSERLCEQTTDPLWVNIYDIDMNLEESTIELNGKFIHSKLLIDCLLRMKPIKKEIEIEKFVRFCQDHNDDNNQKIDMKTLKDFPVDYKEEKALLWYTKASFVFRKLNRALRIQDVDTLFHYGFLIRDIAQQLIELKKNQLLSPKIVYRGQFMTEHELDKLKNLKGNLISMNSFLSTTRSRCLAGWFLGEATNAKPVLFEITINPEFNGMEEFADVSSSSSFPPEEEVLFMLGSIFRIDNIDCNENEICIIHLSLCSDHHSDWEPIFSHMQSQSVQCEHTVLAWGNALYDMGRFDQAKIYYDRCLEELLPNDHILRSYCNYLLGLVATEKGENESALHFFSKSEDIQRNEFEPSDPSIADTLTGIARVHYNKDDYTQAFELYDKSLQIFQKAFGEDDLTSAMCYSNLGVVSAELGDYSNALEYQNKALNIRKKLPQGYFRYGTSYNNIGEVHRRLHRYDEALENYGEALEAYKTSLPPHHMDIAITLVNQGLIYVVKHRLQEALQNYKKAFDICRRTWPATDPRLARIETRIQQAEITNIEAHVSESLGTMFLELFHNFKCIASLDDRSSYRKKSTITH